MVPGGLLSQRPEHLATKDDTQRVFLYRAATVDESYLPTMRVKKPTDWARTEEGLADMLANLGEDDSILDAEIDRRRLEVVSVSACAAVYRNRAGIDAASIFPALWKQADKWRRRRKKSVGGSGMFGIEISVDAVAPDIDKFKTAVACPICNLETPVFLRQVRLNQTIVCRGCHSAVRLADHLGSVGAARKHVERSILDMFDAWSS